jgi:hypothetical protein
LVSTAINPSTRESLTLICELRYRHCASDIAPESIQS